VHKIGLFEAKQKLSELVARAEEGERIGITRRGKLTALLVPARSGQSLREVFEEIDGIRKRARRRTPKLAVKQLIEEGRT
jgi:prevent-host-death family protein